LLLRVREERPCCRRAAEQRDEFASPHGKPPAPTPSSNGAYHRVPVLCVTATTGHVRFVPISDITPYTRVRSHDKLMELDVPGRGIV
jgi:hypothetical protein